MILRIYPDLIVEDTLPTYSVCYSVDVIKRELAKSEPDALLCCVLLNGDKYNES